MRAVRRHRQKPEVIPTMSCVTRVTCVGAIDDLPGFRATRGSYLLPFGLEGDACWRRVLRFQNVNGGIKVVMRGVLKGGTVNLV